MTAAAERALSAVVGTYGEMIAVRLAMTRLIAAVATEADDPKTWLAGLAAQVEGDCNGRLDIVTTNEDFRVAVEAAAMAAIQAMFDAITVTEQPEGD